MRYLDTSTGRWLSPDPRGFVDGQNLFAYVRANPVMHRDPSGLFVEIYCRNLQAAPRLSTLLGVKHCGVRVYCDLCSEAGVDPSTTIMFPPGSEKVYRDMLWEIYGRDPTGGPGFVETDWVGPATNGNDGTPWKREESWTLPGFAAPCERENLVVARALNYRIAPPPYDKLGPNSNTYAHAITKGVLYVPLHGVWAVGWDE